MTLSSIRDRAVLLTAALLCAACSPQRVPVALNIAAAADLQFALDDLSRQFHAGHPGIAPQIVYGSSGNFYSQILNQAPFDLFLSADLQYPLQLTERGLARRSAVFEYGVGRLAVWVPEQSPLDPAAMRMQVFTDPSIRHVAIANPRHAPYGRAAEAALRSAGVYDRIAGKLVFGENIAQTLQYVQSGAADIGIVALSLAAAPALRGKGRYWEVPLESYPRLWQGGVVLNGAKNAAAAEAFRAYLTSPEGRRILEQYGFSLPDKK